MSMRRPFKPFSTYVEAINYLYSLKRFIKDKQHLDGALFLHQKLGLPAKQYPAVHVAGTNGKGSVATKIAAGLELSGKRVGLFTSPHLVSFCERIRINGEMIPNERVLEGLNKVFFLAKDLDIYPTFFEFVTNLAADYFVEENVDIAVFEVGIGGKRDATQIINPVLSVITSISFDHVGIIGNTLEEIAKEKAGIIKTNTPLILGPSAKLSVIEQIAKAHHAPTFFVEGYGSTFEEDNQATAHLALKALNIPNEHIKKALEKRPPCRFEERMLFGVPIILDVAHNVEGIKKLSERLTLHFSDSPIELIYATAQDKDYEPCLRHLKTIAKHIHYPIIEHTRLLHPKHLDKTGHFYQTIDDALRAALTVAKKENGIVVICGSFYLMEFVIPWLETAHQQLLHQHTLSQEHFALAP